MNATSRLLVTCLLLAQYACMEHEGSDKNTTTETIQYRMEKTHFNLPVQSSFRGLCVVNAETVWASGSNGTFIRTIDGGQHWTADSIAGSSSMDFRDVEAFDAQSALVMNAGFPGKMYKTTDGGQNWQETYSNMDEAIFLDGFDFWDQKSGIAFGDPMNGKLLILKTDDGGESWKEIDRHCIPDQLKTEAGFAASGTGVVTWGDHRAIIGLGGTKARVFYCHFEVSLTDSLCSTWTAMETPMVSGNASRGIYSITFGSPLQGIAVGGAWNEDSLSNTAIFTSDGGMHWQTANGIHAYRLGSCYVKDDIYLATGPSGTDITYNGGKDWLRLDDEGMNAIAFDKDGWTGYAAGPKGKIFRFELVRL